MMQEGNVLPEINSVCYESRETNQVGANIANFGKLRYSSSVKTYSSDENSLKVYKTEKSLDMKPSLKSNQRQSIL